MFSILLTCFPSIELCLFFDKKLDIIMIHPHPTLYKSSCWTIITFIPAPAVPTNNVYDIKPHWAVDFFQTVNARNTGMETVQKEAQNVLVMMDINTLKRKTNVLVRIMPCY